MNDSVDSEILSSSIVMQVLDEVDSELLTASNVTV